MLGQRSLEDFHKSLREGKVFEAKVNRLLERENFPIGMYWTKSGQHEFGESRAHVEIKNDTRFKDTGNNAIETEERRTSASKWRPAGIYDKSNPWFYVIGDESKLWMLGVRQLQRMFVQKLEDGSWKYKRFTNWTNTGKGFLLKVEVANWIAIKIWENWDVPLLHPNM